MMKKTLLVLAVTGLFGLVGSAFAVEAVDTGTVADLTPTKKAELADMYSKTLNATYPLIEQGNIRVEEVEVSKDFNTFVYHKTITDMNSRVNKFTKQDQVIFTTMYEKQQCATELQKREFEFNKDQVRMVYFKTADGVDLTRAIISKATCSKYGV